MKFTPTEAETLQRILHWRLDVRHFQTAPVAADVLDRLQAAMASSPSVGNSRPWRIICVKSAALRSSVRVNFNLCNAEAAAHYSDDKQEDYRRLKLAGLDAAPVQLAVFTLTEPVEGHGLGRRTLPETLRQSTAMAIHTLWLAARVENIGLGIVSILDPRAMEELFAVPKGWEFSAYLCLGHSEFTDDTPLLHRAGWQENQTTVWEVR